LIIEASNADLNGKTNVGRSFVVFGTADTDVIELSSVTSGTVTKPPVPAAMLDKSTAFEMTH
jgi:hypothetical protein